MWHRFSNSRLPEKPLAEAAGLGCIGRNSLLIARRTASGSPEWSSAVVIGLMLLPFDILEDEIPPAREPIPALSLCGNCARCIDACPTRALKISGERANFNRSSCLQNYAGRAGELPANITSAWKDQLYGCDLCLEACPFFLPDPDAKSDLGRLGAYFDAAALVGQDDDRLKAELRGSALDQKWIAPQALKRNAAMAARHSDR